MSTTVATLFAVLKVPAKLKEKRGRRGPLHTDSLNPKKTINNFLQLLDFLNCAIVVYL